MVTSTTRSFFVTGTDTDVGKTYVCNLLLQQLNQQGQRAIGYKPIAAGAELTAEGLRNDDALILQQASAGTPDYDLINPICYQAAIAPHIAASLQGEEINTTQLNQWWKTRMESPQPNRVKSLQLKKVESLQPTEGYAVEVVEGAGGWRLPLNDRQWLSEFVVDAKLDVILVVGMKLGCLNHAILTVEAIKNDGLKIVGWIANQLAQPMEHYQTNLDYLIDNIAAPLLGEVKSNQKVAIETPLFDLSFI